MPPDVAAPDDTEQDIKPTPDEAPESGAALQPQSSEAPTETSPSPTDEAAPASAEKQPAVQQDQFQPEAAPERPQPVTTYELPADNPDARHQDAYARVDKQMTDAFNEQHPFAPSGSQPAASPEQYDQAAQQADVAAARQAHADRLARNADVEAQMRGSSQKFYTDPYGNIQPVVEEGTGKPLYTPSAKRERAMNPQTGEPAWMTMDRYGQTQYQRPNIVANPSDPHDKQLYYDFGNGQQEPAGKIDDLLKSSDFKVQRAALKAVHAQRSASWKEAIAPMQQVAAGASSAYNDAQQKHDEAQTQIEQLQAQADQLSQNPQFNETTGGVMGFGAKPSDTALQLQAQHSALQNQLDTLTGQRNDLASQLKPGGSLARQKRDATAHLAAFKAKASYDNYADLAQERRAILKNQGQPEDSDPTLQSILKAQKAYQGAIGKFGAQLQSTQAGQSAQGDGATPTGDSSANPDQAEPPAGFAGEPYQLAANGVKNIGTQPIQNLARDYGSGQGTPKPAALLAMKQRVADIADTLSNKGTTLDDKVRDSMQKESDYLNGLYAQRFAKLAPDDQRKISTILDKQNIGAVSDAARRFTKGLVEAPGQITAGTGRLAQGAQQGITNYLLKAYEAKHGPIPADHREALLGTINDLVDKSTAMTDGGLSPSGMIKAGEKVKDIAGKIDVNPNREGSASGTLAEGLGNVVGSLPAAGAGLPGAVLAGSGMMREQMRDQALASGDSKDIADAKGNMAALAGGLLGLVPGAPRLAGKTLTAAAGRVATKGLAGAAVNAAADIALQKASTGKIDWKEAGQQAQFGGIFGSLFELPEEFRGRAQARIEEAAKGSQVDAGQAQKIIAEERAKAQKAGVSLEAPPELPASTEAAPVSPERNIVQEPTTPAQKSALAIHEGLTKQEAADKTVRQSPQGYDLLKQQLLDEQSQAAEQSRKLSTPELEARRDAIEKQLGDLEQLRQSPQGAELLKQDLTEKSASTPLPPDKVSKLGPKEFSEYASGIKGGFTEDAYRVGRESAGDKDAIGKLSAARDSALEETKQAMNEKRMNDALSLASKAQFFREAIEAATGTGSAAHAMASEISQPPAAPGDKAQAESPQPGEAGPAARPSDQVTALKAINDKGYQVHEDGKFSVLTDAAGKQVREGEVPPEVNKAFQDYREAKLRDAQPSARDKNATPKSGSGEVSVQPASETDEGVRGENTVDQSTAAARQSNAEKDTPTIPESVEKPNVATMKRPELTKELAEAGISDINGKPVADANPAQLMNAVFKLRKAQAEGKAPTGGIRISDKLISALESVKIHKPGQLSAATPFSLAWDAAVDAAILSIKAGRAINDVVKIAAGRLKERFPGATQENVKKLESVLRQHAGVASATPAAIQPAVAAAKQTTSKLSSTWKNVRSQADLKATLAATRDAADNKAGNYSREVRNTVNDALARSVPNEELAKAQKALTFYRENGGDVKGLQADRAKIEASTKADPKVKAQALAAIDYALSHTEQLKDASGQYGDFTNQQVDREQSAGLPTIKTENYVPRYQDVKDGGFLEGGKMSATGASNRKVRSFDKLADSISAGIDPKSMNAIDTLETRIRNGETGINVRAWQKSLKDFKDPASKDPIAVTPPRQERADGSHYYDPPKGYEMATVGNEPVAVKKDYSGIVSALTDPSWFSKNKARLAAQKVNALGKGIALAVDTFHLGRLAFRSTMVNAASLTGPKKAGPSFREGLTLLEHSPAEIMRMGKSGEIPSADVPTYLENKKILNGLTSAGLNTGRVADAMHQELIQKVPIAGSINKFIFQKFQRGATADAAILEYKRQKASYPEMSDQGLMHKVANEVNTRFGNLGRQGIFKSATAQDLMRMLVLAPQWNEGLIRSEAGGVGQIAKSAFDAATGRRFAMGLLGREMLTTGVALFAASQIINQMTRGKFTWENPEEGFGSKISAWIPDKIGGGAGFFLNPMGLTAETAHLLLNSYEKSGNTYEPVVNYLRSRASAITKPLWTFATGKNQIGQNIKPEDRWKETAKAAIPAPISGGAVARVVKGLATGGKTEKFPGEFQKQAMQSFGLRTENAPSPEQRVMKLAHEFNQKHNVPAGPNDISDYQDLNDALRRNNPDDIKTEIEALLKKKSAAEIERRYEALTKRSFTGSKERETDFIKTLTPEQRTIYVRAQQDRRAIAQRAVDAIRHLPTPERMAEAQ